MHISNFEICNTCEEEQLYGSIIIINIDNETGYAIITVKENSPLEHSSLEEIKSEDNGSTWKLANGTTKQKWFFEFLGSSKGSKHDHTNCKYNNDEYSHYLRYTLNAPGGKPCTKGKNQGNGTGTAGGD